MDMSFYTYVLGSGDDESVASSDSEYVPIKKETTLVKRGRGRPRKNPESPPKPKSTRQPGRPRGRPPGRVIKKEKEEEEYGEFPCPACNEIFNTMSSLDRHARIQHEGLKVCIGQFSVCIA